MKTAWFLSCAILPFFLLQNSSQTNERSFAFGSSPTWILGEGSVTVELSGAASLAGPCATAMFPQSSEESRQTYLALPLLQSPGNSANTKSSMQGKWRILVLPPNPSDLSPRSLKIRGEIFSAQTLPFRVESSCGSCGHKGPAIWTQTSLGVLELPVKLDAPANETPPPSKVRF